MVALVAALILQKHSTASHHPLSLYPTHCDDLRYNYYFLASAHTHRSVYVAPPHLPDPYFVICLIISYVASVLCVRALQVINFG